MFTLDFSKNILASIEKLFHKILKLHKKLEKLLKPLAWMKIRISVKNKKVENPVNTWLYLET